ncbi:MAG: hypothetical protein U0573_09950 [Phycisphaerales bacterium]|nr:hypothetical protein [Planctomycetota bacterium]
MPTPLRMPPTPSHPSVPPPRCENCGYEIGTVLESGGPEARCPECGVLLAESAPARRTGTPWQLRISPASYWLTTWGVIAYPVAIFRLMEASGRRAFSLLFVQCLIAAIAFIAPWSGVFVADPVRQLRFARTWGRIAQIFSTVALEVLVLTALLMLGTVLIGFALGAYGKARSGPMPRGTMRSILAHASVGWLVVAGVVWSLLTAWFIATLLLSSSSWSAGSRALAEFSGWLSTRAAQRGAIMLPLIVFGSGAAIVSRLALVGLTACRAANSPETGRLFARNAPQDVASKGEAEHA